jgi:hypothetical protein
VDRFAALGAAFLLLAAATAGYVSFGVQTGTDAPDRENRAYVAAPLATDSGNASGLDAGQYEDFEDRAVDSLWTVRSWNEYGAPERTRRALRTARNGTVPIQNSTVTADLARLLDGETLLAVDERHYRYSLSRGNGTTTLTGVYANAAETRQYVLAHATVQFESLNASERDTFAALREAYRRNDTAGYYPFRNETLTDRSVLVERNGTRYVVERTLVHAGGVDERAVTRLSLWIAAALFAAVGGTVLAARRWRPE